MKNYIYLSNYKINEEKNPTILDNVAKDFKNYLSEKIKKEFLSPNLNERTVNRIQKNIINGIKVEHNTVNIPYYQILENINMCIELENIITETNKITQTKIGEKKFSEIIQNGIDRKVIVNEFSVTESKLLSFLESSINKYTSNYNISEDSIEIEFN